MSGSAIVLASLLLGQPSFVVPPDPLWSACETGELKLRLESCARIVGDTNFDLRTRSWALVLTATAHADAGDRQAAIADLERAIRMDAANWTAYRLRGELHLQVMELAAALADLDHAIELMPDDPYNRFSKAAYLRTTGDYAEARREIDQAILLDPELNDLYIERARIEAATGDRDQATRDFERYRDHAPPNPVTDYNLAIGYVALSHLPEALAAIDRSLAAVPEDADALRVRANIQHSLGDLEAAYGDIEHAFELSPENPSILYDRGNLNVDRGEWRAAIDDLTAALPAYPDDPTILIQRGLAYSFVFDDASALRDADAALTLDGKNPRASWLKAITLLYLGRLDEGLETVNAAVAIAPDDIDIAIVRGRLLLAQDNAIAAIGVFSEVIARAPQSVEAAAFRAVALAATGFPERARGILEDIVKDNPRNALVREQLVTLLQRNGNADAALHALTPLIARWPSEPGYRWREAAIRLALDDPERGLAAFAMGKLLYHGAEPVDFLREYGIALSAQARFVEAIAVYEEALAKAPDDALTLAWLGISQQSVGRYVDAAADLRRAIELLPAGDDGRWAWVHLGWALNGGGRYDAVLSEMSGLLAVYPGDPDGLVLRARAYFSLGRTSEAQADVEAALLAQPAPASAYLLKADILEEAGARDDALSALDSAVEAWPDEFEPRFKRSWARQQAGLLEAALDDLDEALALVAPGPSSDRMAASNNRADVLLRLGRIDEARTEARRCTEEYPDNEIPWVTLGEILVEAKEPVGAVEALDTGIALGFSGPDAHFFRAVAQLELGAKAAAFLDLAVAAQRDDGRFANRIAALKQQATGQGGP